jgi:hypothetical protein
VVCLLLAACRGNEAQDPAENAVLRISATPDQDPAALAEREDLMAAYLAGSSTSRLSTSR